MSVASHVFGNKSPFLPLCFSIPSQFHLCAPRFSLLMKPNNPKREKNKEREKFSYAFPLRWDSHQLKTDAASVRQYTDRLTDWVTDWLESLPLYAEEQQCSLLRPHRVSSLLRAASRPVPFPTWEPPRCRRHAATARTLSTLAGNNFGRIIDFLFLLLIVGFRPLAFVYFLGRYLTENLRQMSGVGLY